MGKCPYFLLKINGEVSLFSPQTDEKLVQLDAVAQTSGDREPMDLDTLNTPAGKLVGVFLAACPNLEENNRPFAVDGAPTTMRNAVISATGRSGLIARHRMIEALPYFLNADPEWTNKNLITPLLVDNSEALALWRAIARRTHSHNVLKIIGGVMAEMATDQRLGRETRQSLVFSIVIECLFSFYEGRDSAVPCTRVQQMIRSLDDEVRAYAADAVQRFVSDLSSSQIGDETPPPVEQLFRSAAAPFLSQVWPQEFSITTPGISRALANLPATSKGAFVEAVDAIERFLVPFDCWSMLEYGLYGEENDEPRLSIIDNQNKAFAFLRLLNKTIGTSEGAVIPYDLAKALEQIRSVDPSLSNNQAFRRLATAARR